MRLLAAALTLLATTAMAEPPRIVADIPPVHGLVSALTEGVTQPALLLPPGTDPHDHALRPSDARALQEASLVVWIGPALTPWLEDPLATLAPTATRLTLLEASPVQLPFRADEDEDEGHDHDHAHSGETDPHLWLHPDNASAWVQAIAAALSAADPEHASTYARNAETLEDRLAEAAATPGLPTPAKVIAYHDAFQYLEATLGLTGYGAVSPADGAAPGPAHLAELAATIAAEGITCVLAQPGYDAGLVDAAFSGRPHAVAVIDDLAPSLPDLLEQARADVAACLASPN